MVEKGPVQQSEACEVSWTVSEVNKTNGGEGTSSKGPRHVKCLGLVCLR